MHSFTIQYSVLRKLALQRINLEGSKQLSIRGRSIDLLEGVTWDGGLSKGPVNRPGHTKSNLPRCPSRINPLPMSLRKDAI